MICIAGKYPTNQLNGNRIVIDMHNFQHFALPLAFSLTYADWTCNVSLSVWFVSSIVQNAHTMYVVNMIMVQLSLILSEWVELARLNFSNNIECIIYFEIETMTQTVNEVREPRKIFHIRFSRQRMNCTNKSIQNWCVVALAAALQIVWIRYSSSYWIVCLYSMEALIETSQHSIFANVLARSFFASPSPSAQ